MLTEYTAAQLAHLGQYELSDKLEQGKIIYFPECPFPLPEAEDLDYLRSELPKLLKLKNISYHPEADKVRGIEAAPEVVERVLRILRRHRTHTNVFLRQVIPAFSRQWYEGSLSFRPLQEEGRQLKPHASNELIHIDAGAYGATHGGRILRFFVNVHPSEDRTWQSKGALPEVLARWGNQAGVLPGQADHDYLEETLGDQLLSGLIRLLAMIQPMARVLDTSPYDRTMRRLHNFMKDTPAFQQDPVGHEELHFAPGSAWMVLTDMVSHACRRGQHCFVSTNIVPLECCRYPELAPLSLLRGGAEGLTVPA